MAEWWLDKKILYFPLFRTRSLPKTRNVNYRLSSNPTQWTNASISKKNQCDFRIIYSLLYKWKRYNVIITIPVYTTRQYLFTRIYNARFQRLFLDDSSWLIEHRYNAHQCCSIHKVPRGARWNYLASSDAADYRFSLLLSPAMRASCGNSLPPSKRSSGVGMDPCAQQDCQWRRVLTSVCVRASKLTSAHAEGKSAASNWNVSRNGIVLSTRFHSVYDTSNGIMGYYNSRKYRIFSTQISLGKFFDRRNVLFG